jgi:hypothetical protein
MQPVANRLGLGSGVIAMRHRPDRTVELLDETAALDARIEAVTGCNPVTGLASAEVAT